MGCGTSKAIPVQDDMDKKSDASAEGNEKSDIDMIEDMKMVEEESKKPKSKFKPLVQDKSAHQANMLLTDWSKKTEDVVHNKIMKKINSDENGSKVAARTSRGSVNVFPPERRHAKPRKLMPAAQRNTNGDSSDYDSSGDEVSANQENSRAIRVATDKHNNVVDDAIPGAIPDRAEPSLMAMFRPKSALRLDLD